MVFESLIDMIEKGMQRKSDKVKVQERLEEMEKNQPSLHRDDVLVRYRFDKYGVDYLTNQPKVVRVVDSTYICAIQQYVISLASANY